MGFAGYDGTAIISTHTPHARRDCRSQQCRSGCKHFNSHASCEAWPVIRRCFLAVENYFNSHASCEAWLSMYQTICLTTQFQLTRLMRGVTSLLTNSMQLLWFQLTRLMRGVTLVDQLHDQKINDFNSHASCEAWLQPIYCICFSFLISTHTPHARRDKI